MPKNSRPNGEEAISEMSKMRLINLKESRTAKFVNVQGRENADLRVAKYIFVCGILPFIVVRSPY